MKPTKMLVFFLLGFGVQIYAHQPNQDRSKGITLKGTVFRSDKNHPVARAVLILLDEKKSETKDNSLQTQTDENGTYTFENVKAGKYTVSIRSWYKSKEEVPCQLLMAKTKDKDSSLIVVNDKQGVVELVFIKGFAVKGDKEMQRDFDIACKGMFDK